MDLTILVIGDERHPEFAGPIARLARFGRVKVFADPRRAEEELVADGLVPDVIVLAGAYPGRFPSDLPDRLRSVWPLSRILALLGSWCEGELRSGYAWPSVVRLYWHQWPARAERELLRLSRGECPSWGLPVTASEEERLQAAAGDPFRGKARFAAVVSRKRANYEWLAAACRQRGWATVWIENFQQSHVQGIHAVLLDGISPGADGLEEIRQVARRFHPAQLTVLADFPRIEDVAQMQAAGAAAVLAKPVLLEDLFWQLEQVSPQGSS
jgi:CheY-like chemotaxis protein